MALQMGGNLLFDTNLLIEVVPNLKRAQTFLLDKFFPNIVTADSEFVAIDVDVGKRRMAPFVSPLVEGRLVEQRRMQTNTFKPAYIKDKRAPDLRKPIRRMIGERLGGDMTGLEREMADLEAEMTDQIDILTRRLEWMAAQVLMNGTVTITGDGFPTTLIDFSRDATTDRGARRRRAVDHGQRHGRHRKPDHEYRGLAASDPEEIGATVSDLIFTT